MVLVPTMHRSGRGGGQARGEYGGAVRLNGTSSALVRLPIPREKQFGTSSFAVRCWFCPTKLDIDSQHKVRRLFAFNKWPEMYVYVDVRTSGVVSASIRHQSEDKVKTGGQVASSTRVGVNEWAHFAVVCDRQKRTLRLYLNGKLEGEGALSSDFEADLTMDKPMTLGSGWQSFHGLVGELVIERGVVSAEQVQAAWEDARAVYAAPLAMPVIVRPTVAGAPREYFVSPQGNDGWSGTLAEPNAAGTDGPFCSVAKAAEVARPGDTCSFREGVYREVLKPACSGTAAAPITFQNYEGERALLVGTEPLTGWRDEGGGMYSAPLRWSMGHTNQLFADGVMLTEARWPNNAGTLLQPTRATVTAGTVNTITDPELPGDEDFWKGAWLWCAGGSCWHCWCRKVTAFDAQTKTLTFEPSFTPKDRWYIPRKGNKYVLMGTRNALDAEGEWWFDPTQRRVYLRPPSGATPNTMAIEAKQRLSVIDLSGRSHIKLIGLAFRAGGVWTDKASSDLLLKGLRGDYTGHSYVRNVGAAGAVFVTGRRNDVIGCEFSHSSGTLLRVTGEENRVVNCYVHEGDYAGQWAGTVVLRGRRHVVSRNTFRHSGRDLISVSGLAESIVEYNDLSRAGWLTKDLGMTYGHTTDFLNTVFRYNHVHDNMALACSMGIYFDHLSMNVIVHNNLIWNVGMGAVQFNNPSFFCLSFHNSTWNAGRTSTFDHSKRNDLFGTRFYNNILSGEVRLPAHVFRKGNTAGKTPGYVDPDKLDFSLKADSPAVDAGIPIAGLNDHWSGDAPDAGALECGRSVWKVGHDFNEPPSIPEWAPADIPCMNGIFNSCFEHGLEGWTPTGVGKAKNVGGNGWGNGYGRSDPEPTGTCKSELELGPGLDGVEQTVSGLFPNTCYTLSGWLKVPEGGETVMLGVREFGGAEPELSGTTDSNVWTRLTVEFKTGPENTSALVFLRKTSAGPGFVRCDNLGLPRLPKGSDWERPPPEPAPRKLQIQPVPPPFAVTQVSAPIVVDGRITPGEWPGAQLLMKQRPNRDLLGTAPCRARLCHRDNTLYVAVTVPVKDANALKQGKQWGKDDGIELCFVDAKGAAPTYSFALHGFCGGASESVTDGKASEEAAAQLGSAAQYAAAVAGKTWTGEWAIPLNAADIQILPGLKLAFNLCVHRSESKEWVLWVGTNGAAWRLDNAGIIEFILPDDK